ncbi:CbiQ family ECF transporter T component [Corynebacterium bovis]|uniref:Biotin transport system permease protein n=1 Tax=Corynebacterium bovis DSM 20582 = CIP 54.80 TaxID=927655 RepID=A0A8H9YAQ6_9CORY|nr:CbiQ family ECF transporter T component [Corynebacterium bovis]MBB3116571.1 biotin transport system permease protein [Corynebacterium bovis DSM 20582 = CIP 54.80]QQC47677.1 energy-coupling factor transporter transmembrane protein EcfT [Corynebacterium bovis]WJY77478.1 Energy-coupling factor transporter transmembrane protein EcfT [Corynebacterium bovis DSM 20582 = CIP 54.80]
MIRPSSIPLGVYVPRRSPVHALPPTVKLVVLVGFVVLTSLAVTTWPRGLVALGAVVVGFAVARLPVRVVVRQLVAWWPVLVTVGVLSWWRGDAAEAVTTVLTLWASAAAASLLTLTTRVEEMMDSLDAALAPLSRPPLARLGVPVETVSLALSLTLRLIPRQVVTVSEVLDARKARGAERSVRALAVPVVVQTVTTARRVADALAARGVGD